MNRSETIRVYVSSKDSSKQVEVKLTYDLGGWNRPRGYYAGVYPITRSDHFQTYALFSGASDLIQRTNRYNQGTFYSLALRLENEIERGIHSNITKLIDQVFIKNNLDPVEYGVC